MIRDLTFIKNREEERFEILIRDSQSISHRGACG